MVISFCRVVNMFKKVNVQKTNDSKHHRSPWIVRWREPVGKRPKRCFPTKTMANMFAVQISTEINAPLFKQTVPKQWQDLLDKFLAAKKAEGLHGIAIFCWPKFLM